MKTCSKCTQEKAHSEFYQNSGNADGLEGSCKDCRRAYFKTDPERWRVRAESQWVQRLRRDYGITLEQYNAMNESQGGVCAICSQPETALDPRLNTLRRLAVDHCHETGRVRGLLCTSCNVSLGRFGDDPERLERAAAYLRNQSHLGL